MSIKVLIQTNKFGGGGPDTFRSRLIKAIKKTDEIDVVENIKKKFDIELSFIRKTEKHNKPYILRASNCYYLDKYKIWNNKPIARSIKDADYIIFQSEFGYKLYNRVLRLESRKLIRNGYKIIHNGIDVDYLKNIEPSREIEPGSFVACARWDSNKRLHSMIKGFIEADVKKHLYIIGGFGIEDRKRKMKDVFKKYNSQHVHILGEKTNEETISIMKAGDYFVHLAFIDICPNVVIEALSCGLNVLCTNLGGTSELVGDNGIVLKVDKFWETKYLKKNIEDLDKLKSKVVAEGINKIIKIKKSDFRNDFDINKIAKKYIDIIKERIK